MRLVWFILLVLIFNEISECKKGRHKGRMKGIQWWSLANLGERSNDLRSSVTRLYNNPSLLPLNKRQRRLVTRNPGAIMAVVKGAKLAIKECQYQFRNRRWNCPTFADGHGGSIFGKILQKGCRESAFIYALTSAAVSHSIARACSEGTVHTCTCDYAHNKIPSGKDWEWSGCSDNAKFGHKFSRRFVDVIEKGWDFRYMINLHNNEAGRVHVTSGLKQECKCHGMSGSCTIKTCWMRLPAFRNVGDILKDRFDGATRVLPDNEGKAQVKGNKGRGRGRRRRRFNFNPVNVNHKKPGRRDLVYFENSPSFCEKDNGIGFQGTLGRECNATSIGVDGCDLMCCGRGHTTEKYIVTERCSCTFHWCCHVKCKTCTRTKVKHSCL
ncbi:protein Wnt-1-like isoform X1 [Haliotis rufescens]|uniref:protein Wnt-1-like isoform X1 n=1 Tax=Haliotis rufescens TaxID=6454 RepID=UPI001EB0A18D|nr:protein Wnt-1-like isoform X1 [Haliotis rufescens]